MPEGGQPYFPFPYAPEENFTPPVPGDISGGIVAAPGAGSALDQVVAVAVPPPPVEQPTGGAKESAKSPGLLDKGPALNFSLPPPIGAVTEFIPPTPVEAETWGQRYGESGFTPISDIEERRSDDSLRILAQTLPVGQIPDYVDDRGNPTPPGPNAHPLSNADKRRIAELQNKTVPISQREYLREAPLEAFPQAPVIEKAQYPKDATPEQKAAIDAAHQEQQLLSDVEYRANVEQGIRAATAAAQSALAQDFLNERAKQLEEVRARREQQLKRREEVAQSVEQDYEELRRLAKEKLPEMSSGDKLSLVAVAAAGAINAALNGVQPGQATGTAFQQIIERRAKDRAQEIAGLEKAVGAGEQQLGLLDRATQQTEYLNDLAKADLYEEVELISRSMAAKTTSNVEKFRLLTAAEDAGARARQSIAEARRKEEEFQLKLSKEQREARTEAERLRLQAQELGLKQRELAERRAERTQKAELEAQEREARLEKIRQEMKLAVEGRTVLSPAGGQQLTFRSPADAQDIATKVGAAKKIVDTIDLLQKKRQQYGTEWTAWLKTNEGQRMLALYGDLFFEMKDYKGLGVISGPDEKLIKNVIGGDPTSIQALTAMLDETRSQSIRGANTLMQSRLVRPEELKTFRPWNPPRPTFDVAPDAQQASTAIRTGDPKQARAAVQELIAAEKRKAPDAWAEPVYRALEREQLALEAEREDTKPGSPERKAIDKRIYAIRKGQDEAEDILGRKTYLKIAGEERQQFDQQQQKNEDLKSALGGIMGVKRSDLTGNSYMDALRLYRRADETGDAALGEAVLQSLREAGFSDLQEFQRRARER